MRKLPFLCCFLPVVRWIGCVLGGVFLGLPLTGAELQPFPLPWNDAAPSATSLQSWQAGAAGAEGWVSVTDAGHYAVAGRPIRFLGVNITAASNFPAHALAEGHAARLAKFGFNAVRFHHMDASWIWDNSVIDYPRGSTRQLSADRLDKLHYFVAQLAQHGIYADINLLVARQFQATDGLGAEVTQMSWKDQHILGFFSAAALALHQEYATQLLTAPNPYRGGRSLAQDPAVAFVEIMNENGLLEKWYEGVLDTMPAVYRAELQARWNQWLQQRYATTTALLDAWGAQVVPLGANQLTNGDFASGTAGWNPEQHAGAVAAFTGTTDYDGQSALRIRVTTPGTESWHIQLNQAPVALVAGQVYTVSFWAKAATTTPLVAALSRSYGDYGSVAPGLSVTLDTTWRWYTWSFEAGTSEARARLNFGGFGDHLATVWLADVRLQPGGTVGGLPAGVTLEAGNLPNVLRQGAAAGTTGKQAQDWVRFILGLESAYWSTMSHHLKTTLGYRGIVWGSIISNSPPNAQAVLDATDSHAYWQHPSFDAGYDWDAVRWTVNNVSMVNHATGGVLPGLACQRVQGRPHNVTEYQHPAPNTYSGEAPLLAAAYGALQDWDSLWFFEYGTSSAEYTTGFFDQSGNPSKMANNLLAAALFRRGDVQPARQSYVLPLTPEREVAVAATQGGAWSIADGSHLGVPATLPLVSRVALSIGTSATGLTTPPAAPTGDVLRSDTNELVWDRSLATQGVVTVDTLRTKAVIGFVAGRSFELGGVRIAPGATRQDWCTIGLTLLEGRSFSPAGGGRALIIATGDQENTGQIWKDATRTSVGANWGASPPLIEVVPATVTLPVAAARVQAWALDVTGARSTALTVQAQDGLAQLVLGQSGATVWYEVQIAPAAAVSPEIVTPPAALTINAGAPGTFTVVARGAGTLFYQWQRQVAGTSDWIDLVEGTGFSGTTTDTLTVIKPAYALKGDQFRCVVSDGTNPVTITPAATLTVKWSQFVSLSARALVGTGDQTLILGFVFAGGGKPTMVRGVGPGLVKGDASLAGQELVDPVLTLNELQTVNNVTQFVAIATNDNWGGTDELRTKMSALGMGPLDDTSTDAVLLTTPTRAVYTAQISGANQTTGLALAEVYDANFADKAKRLTALSVRNQVGTGSGVLIVGFVLSGDAPKKLIIRGVGPGLVKGDANLAGQALVNPTLQLNKLNTTTQTWSVVGANDDWGGTAELTAAMQAAGMGALDADSKDAVLLLELPAGLGIYTAQLSGVGDTTGIGLVEVYEAP